MTDTSLDSLFERLIQRQPTDKEKLRLYNAKDALGVDPNESLWLILIALDHYVSLYEVYPQQINDAMATISATAKSEIQRIEALTVERLSTNIVEQANKMSLRKSIQYISMSVFLTACVFTVFSYISFQWAETKALENATYQYEKWVNDASTQSTLFAKYALKNPKRAATLLQLDTTYKKYVTTKGKLAFPCVAKSDSFATSSKKTIKTCVVALK